MSYRYLKETARKLSGLNLDATLTIQTCRRYVSTMPTGTEELRDKYRVMSNMWILAQFRQPGSALCSVLTKDTWAELLEELLSKHNFTLERMVIKLQDDCAELEELLSVRIPNP